MSANITPEMIAGVLRQRLVPRGSAPIVIVGFKDGKDGGCDGGAWFSKTFTDSTIDCLERRLRTASIDPLNPLEKLASRLLLSTAYLSDPASLDSAICSYNEQEKLNSDNDN